MWLAWHNDDSDIRERVHYSLWGLPFMPSATEGGGVIPKVSKERGCVRLLKGDSGEGIQNQEIFSRRHKREPTYIFTVFPWGVGQGCIGMFLRSFQCTFIKIVKTFISWQHFIRSYFTLLFCPWVVSAHGC